MRIRNLCGNSETTYVYDSNAKLSRLLVKTTDGSVTKYVYGRGLIGEETSGVFKTYHFDYRGSTVAITDINGNITDRFEYDTYGKLTSRTGSSDIIFLYNGRDGVVTDGNGLIYMRARYYAPELRRFINADILAGDIANGITLNRYAYANANPVSMIDPRGLAAWWETALKVVAGVAVIATLAVVSVATAGTATAVIAGAAAVGAAVSGGANVVSGVVAGDSADEIASSFLIGTVSGAASGALAASSASAALVATGNSIINVGEIYLEDYADDGVINEVDAVDVALAVGSGIVGAENGMLNKNGKFVQVQDYFDDKIAREARRANSNSADKAIEAAKSYYEAQYQDLLLDYAKDEIVDAAKSSQMDYFVEKGKDSFAGNKPNLASRK